MIFLIKLLMLYVSIKVTAFIVYMGLLFYYTWPPPLILEKWNQQSLQEGWYQCIQSYNSYVYNIYYVDKFQPAN